MGSKVGKMPTLMTVSAQSNLLDKTPGWNVSDTVQQISVSKLEENKKEKDCDDDYIDSICLTELSYQQSKQRESVDSLPLVKVDS